MLTHVNLSVPVILQLQGKLEDKSLIKLKFRVFAFELDLF